MLLVGSIHLYNSEAFSAGSDLVSIGLESPVFNAITGSDTSVLQLSNDAPIVLPNILFMFLSQLE